MANITFNTNPVRKIPINRNSLFYDEKSYNYELMIGKNYIEQDMGQTLVLYQVDAETSQTDAIYGETSATGMRYKTPVEVPCVYEIAEPELKAYDKTKNLGTYTRSGKLTVGVYQETLNELGVEIKKSDILGIQVSETHMELFVVINDGRNNYDNHHAMFGTRPLYRTISAVPTEMTDIQF